MNLTNSSKLKEKIHEGTALEHWPMNMKTTDSNIQARSEYGAAAEYTTSRSLRPIPDLIGFSSRVVTQAQAIKTAFGDAARRSSPSQTVIQRTGPDYQEPSPEKRQVEWFEEGWAAVRQANLDQRETIGQLAVFIQQFMPMMPLRRILEVVSEKYESGALAVWKSLLLDNENRKDRKEEDLRGAQISGRSSNWELSADLGRGSEANVYWGLNRLTEAGAAIKVFRGDTAAHENAFRNEVQAHHLIQQFEREGDNIPNVVRMLDYNSYVRAVVMSRVPGVTVDKVEDLLKDPGRRYLIRGNAEGGFEDVRPPHIDVEAVMTRMQERYKAALEETQSALRKRGWGLADVQPRNTMYDYITETITFIDISLQKS